MRPETDGKFYELDHLVRAGCQDCKGCYDCCKDMGDTIVLDPYDVYQLQRHLGKTMHELLNEGMVALTVVDGLVLPYIQMDKISGRCPYLNLDNRCTIHRFRPGMCRLFPLGRNYEDGKLNYILLTDECKKRNRSKVKVSKWIGIEPAKQYHDYVLLWHDFRKDMIEKLQNKPEQEVKTIVMQLLKQFYMEFPPQEDFFATFLRKINDIQIERHK